MENQRNVVKNQPNVVRNQAGVVRKQLGHVSNQVSYLHAICVNAHVHNVLLDFFALNLGKGRGSFDEMHACPQQELNVTHDHM